MDQTQIIQSQSMLKKQKNSYRIHLFSLCYLVSFVSYAAITTMMYSLYARNGLMKVAIIDGIFAFLGMGPSNMVVLHMLRKYNLKNALIISFFGLLLYEINIMITTIAVDKDLPFFSSNLFIYSLNIVTSILVGVSNSILWTIMPVYIQHHCDLLDMEDQNGSINSNPKSSITVNIGIFWSIYMWCTIIGGVVNIFILGFLNTYIYLLTLIILGGLSILMGMFLVQPFEVNKIDYNTSSTSTRQAMVKQLKNLFCFFKNQATHKLHLPNIFFFSIISGFFFSFYRIFINRLIQKSLPEDVEEQDFNRYVAIVFIFQGIGSIIAGVVQSKIQFLQIKDKKKALIWGLSIVNVLMVVTMLAYNLMKPSGYGYWSCVVIIFIWAVVQIHTKTSAQAYIRQYNGGQLQYYSLSLLFFSIGSIISYLIQSIDNGNTQLILISGIGIVLCVLWIIREPSKQPLIGQIIVTDLQHKNQIQFNGKINQDLLQKNQV